MNSPLAVSRLTQLFFRWGIRGPGTPNRQFFIWAIPCPGHLTNRSILYLNVYVCKNTENREHVCNGKGIEHVWSARKYQAIVIDKENIKHVCLIWQSANNHDWHGNKHQTSMFETVNDFKHLCLPCCLCTLRRYTFDREEQTFLLKRKNVKYLWLIRKTAKPHVCLIKETPSNIGVCYE